MARPVLILLALLATRPAAQAETFPILNAVRNAGSQLLNVSQSGLPNKIGTAAASMAFPTAAFFDVTNIQGWLDSQNLQGTPLVRSYQVLPEDVRVPSDTRDYLADFANTYDNALVGLYYLYSIRPDGADRAKSILSYYSQQPEPFRSNKEYTVGAGELMYLGMFAAQYDRKTNDHQFETLLQTIDKYALDPALNQSGAIMSGAGSNYAFTENNLDALSYLQMRYDMLVRTGGQANLAEAQKIRAREQQIAEWLVTLAYVPAADEHRFRKGFYAKGTDSMGPNDDTFVSDAQLQGIQILSALKKTDPIFYASSGLSKIDLPGLMRAAETRSLAALSYTKPDGTSVFIRGFRFEGDTNQSPISFSNTAMAVRAYNALGETLNEAGMLASLQSAMLNNPDGTQSWAYAEPPGNIYSDPAAVGNFFATPYPGISSTMWSTAAMLALPPNWPYSFAEPVAALPTLPGQTQVLFNGGPPAAPFFDGISYSVWADGPFDLSSLRSVRVTFNEESVGNSFFMRLLPSDGFPGSSAYLNQIPYVVPSNQVLDIPISDFAGPNAKLVSRLPLTPTQLAHILQFSFHSGASAFSLYKLPDPKDPTGRTQQSASKHVTFTRIEGIPAGTAPTIRSTNQSIAAETPKQPVSMTVISPHANVKNVISDKAPSENYLSILDEKGQKRLKDSLTKCGGKTVSIHDPCFSAHDVYSAE